MNGGSSYTPAAATLGAEAVAGEAAGPVVLRLVDCSLLSPPREGPDGRSRYLMLETLRSYGAGLLAETGEAYETAAALAGYALQVARQAAGSQSGDGELAAARWLDAEDATMRQVLAWALDHDTLVALRLANALGWWWVLRGRQAGEYPLVRQAAGGAEAGSGGWCAAQLWLGWAAQFSADPAAALGHFTAVRDAVAGRPPSPALTAALAGRAATLRLMGRTAEADGDARSALTLAREIGDSVAELLALANLINGADDAGNHNEALRLARQAERQITAGIPGAIARGYSHVLTMVLAGAGELAEAGRVAAAGLARARDAGDLWNQALLLPQIVDLDLRAGRADDAAAHLREELRLAVRTGIWLALRIGLSQCGNLCAATGRVAEALTLWAACTAADQREGRTHPYWFMPRWEEQQRRARQALGPGPARAAEDRGAAMSLATAAEYALMLTDPGPPQPAAPGSGQLSARERELVTLVAQGRTNAQIAAQLHISVHTVRSHLDRIRDKTGCHRRTDLTRLALSVGLI